MIKNLKTELMIIVAITLVVFIVGSDEYKITTSFFTFFSPITDAYFKQFFTSITVVGDSFWVFLTSILVCFYCFFFKKNNIFFKKIMINSFFFIFCNLNNWLINTNDKTRGWET